MARMPQWAVTESAKRFAITVLEANIWSALLRMTCKDDTATQSKPSWLRSSP